MNDEVNKTLHRDVLLMVLLNAFTTPMMLSAVNVALPHIARDLHMTAVGISWIPMSYLMASAMFVLIFGRLADIYGRKKIFLIGTCSVVFTSLLAALSSSEVFLLAARFLQGVSAAMLYATQVAIITSVFPREKRGQMIGYTVAAIYLGLSAGPLLGGYLVDMFGWRAGFVFHIPLAVVVLLIAFLRVPRQEWSSEEHAVLDLGGSSLYALSIILLCAGVSLLPGTAGIFCVVLSAAGFWSFIRHEYAIKDPVFDVSQFFINRIFTFSCLASLLMYTATFANVVLVSLYLQYILAMSATSAGMIMMTQPLTMALLSPLCGRLSDHTEPRVIATAGVVVTALGLFMLSGLGNGNGASLVIVALIITGTGFSLFSSPNVNAIMSSVGKKYYGSATAAMATMRIVGQLASMVLVTLVFSLLLADIELSVENTGQLGRAISTAFFIASVLCLGGVVFSLARGRMR